MAGFLGFFNYEKEGKGVDKNEPQKKGIARFFELFFRKFWKYVQISIMYFITCIPALIIYTFFGMVMFQDLLSEDSGLSMAIILYANLLLIFGSSSPFKAGFVYILRNFTREEHAWIFSDFFTHTKNNIKQALAVFLIDLAVALLLTINIRFYLIMGAGNLIYMVAFIATVIATCIYVAMQPYIWSMMVTFRLTLKQIYKNAFIFSILGIKRNIIITVVNAGVFLILANYLQPLFMLFVYFLVLLAASGLVAQMNIQPVIKKYLLDRLDTESEDIEEEEESIYGDDLPENYGEEDVDDTPVQEPVGENDIASLFNNRKDSGYDD